METNYVELAGVVTRDAKTYVAGESKVTKFGLKAKRKTNSGFALVNIQAWNDIAKPLKDVKQGDMVAVKCEVTTRFDNNDKLQTDFEVIEVAKVKKEEKPKNEPNGQAIDDDMPF